MGSAGTPDEGDTGPTATDEVTTDDVTKDDVTKDDVTKDDVTKDDVTKDDVKRRFREALDRKNGQHGDATAGGEGGDHAKVHGGAHGPAQQQRQFRRKSG